MRTGWEVLQEASRIRHQFVGDTGYGVVYGSHPSGTATSTSDLDLVLVSPQQLTPGQLDRLVNAVLRLHHDHGLALDTEVDYMVKVHATCADVTAAVSLRCFDTTDDGHLDVAPVVVEPAFLNSEPFRLRLLLNALTSPHTFLGGDTSLYEDHRRRAERALALLALALHDKALITLPTAVRALTEGPDGARGKDFLGYDPGPHMFSVLHCGLAQFAVEGIVRDLDGTRFGHDPAARRAVIAQLRMQNAAERDPARGPGTMV